LPGESILKQSIVLNEEGSSYIDIVTKAGKLHVVIAHPTTDKIEVTGITGSYKNITLATRDRITVITIEVQTEGTIKIGLKASSDSSLNPAYLEIKYENMTTMTKQMSISSPTSPSPSSSLSSTPPLTSIPSIFNYLIWIIIGVILAIVVGLTYILMKKRKTTSQSTSPPSSH
jgi:hypothetical protein